MIDPFLEGLSGVLRSLGVSQEEIDRAMKDGPQGLTVLFADRALIQGSERLTRSEVASRVGISVDDASAFWRSLGFADVDDDDDVFTEVDVDMLGRVVHLINSQMIDRDLALQTARVIGRSSAQVAAALVDTFRGSLLDGVEKRPAIGPSGFAELLADIDRWIVYVWRRHLAAESKRAVIQMSALEAGQAIVGFGDLVGFTGITQTLDQHELAAAVARFEETAVDLVARHDGRTIKMIGDEVMFEAPTPLQGAEIALDLVDAFASDETLPDVRVGVASGPAIRNQGDIFGTAPNLASRLVDQSYPGTVLISESMYDVLHDEPGFTFKAVRPHVLKGFGRVRYWVLRRAGDERPRPALKLPFIEELKWVTDRIGDGSS